MAERISYLLDFNNYFDSDKIVNNDDKIIVWNEIVKDLIPYKLSLDENSIYWFDTQGNWYFEHEKNGDFWCSHQLVWSIFENEFNMRYNDIQFFIKNQIEEVFRRPIRASNGVASELEEAFRQEVIRPYAQVVPAAVLTEEAFKREAITPQSIYHHHQLLVEEALKIEVITPRPVDNYPDFALEDLLKREIK